MGFYDEFNETKLSYLLEDIAEKRRSALTKDTDIDENKEDLEADDWPGMKDLMKQKPNDIISSRYMNRKLLTSKQNGNKRARIESDEENNNDKYIDELDKLMSTKKVTKKTRGKAKAKSKKKAINFQNTIQDMLSEESSPNKTPSQRKISPKKPPPKQSQWDLDDEESSQNFGFDIDI